MLDVIWNITVFIITFSLLVTVHEFGHFYMARFYGIKVNCFSIGFGKSIFRFNINDTEFVISLIPIGGYVRMLDERMDNVPAHLLHRTFNRQPIWKRAVVILSGPIANLMLAIFIYSILFFKNTITVVPVIGEVVTGSVIEKAEIKPGMEIKKIDNITTTDWSMVRIILMSKRDRDITLTLLNPNKNIFYTKKINLNEINIHASTDPLLMLGLIPARPITNFIVAKVNRLNKYSLKVGDIITKLEGHLLPYSQPFINYIREYKNKNIILDIRRNNKVLRLKVKTDTIIKDNIYNNLLLIPQTIFPKNYKIIKRHGLIYAINSSIIKTWQLVKLIIYSIFDLISGNLNINNLNGPITIAKGASISAKHGIISYLSFLSLISINLSVFNLFPLPVLDGGHLLFLIIEKIKGKPLSEQFQNICSLVGFSILIILIVIAVSNDFSNFVSSKI
ncbi:RIP metalloprotease RseP [Candidatus Pantoea edessiphila]|nr:RIP metalloprotease RseP [Candidatus Pantoea edessiphila]